VLSVPAGDHTLKVGPDSGAPGQETSSPPLKVAAGANREFKPVNSEFTERPGGLVIMFNEKIQPHPSKSYSSSGWVSAASMSSTKSDKNSRPTAHVLQEQGSADAKVAI
jgi:hypothetical protein